MATCAENKFHNKADKTRQKVGFVKLFSEQFDRMKRCKRKTLYGCAIVKAK